MSSAGCTGKYGDPRLNSNSERKYDSHNISRRADRAANSVNEHDNTTEFELGEHDIRGEYHAVRADHDDGPTFCCLVFWRQAPKHLCAPHLYIW